MDELESWISKTYFRIHEVSQQLLNKHYSENELDSNFDTELELKVKLDEVIRLINILLDFTWEKLNIGHWKDVLLVWRKLYSFLSLFKVEILVLNY